MSARSPAKWVVEPPVLTFSFPTSGLSRSTPSRIRVTSADISATCSSSLSR